MTETAIQAINADTAIATTESDQPRMRMCLGFPVEGYQGVKKMFNVLNNSESFADSKKTELELSGLVIKPGERVDPIDGTITPCEFAIMVDVEGNSYFSQSDGIADSVENLISTFNSMGGWPEGETVKVRLVTIPLEKGKTLKKLELV